MDRPIVYDGAIPQTTDILNGAKFGMVGLAYACHGILGTSTVVEGLACAPVTSTLQVTVGVGSIYSLDEADATAYGDLGTDTASIMKQGVNYTPVTLTVTPPSTAGFSQVFLVEAIYADVDGGSEVLSYFNASNPSAPYSGPANDGMSQNTIRRGVCTISLKAGVAATTGTQTTPSPDAGYTGLYAITVANGATQVVSGNIVQLTTAPFFPTLPAVPADVQDSSWIYAVDTSAGGAPLTTNATTSTSSSVLHFASVPGYVQTGMKAFDLTTPTAITGGQTVSSISSSTIVLSGNVNVGVGSGDSLTFSNDAYVASISPTPTALTPGLTAKVKLNTTNAGTATLNLNGLGATTIHRGTGAALAAGDLASGMIVEFVYDGSAFQVLNFEGFSGGTISNNTISIPYCADTGTVNAIVAPFSPSISSLAAGQTIEVKIANTNSGATTITVNSNSPVNVTDRYGNALVQGALNAGEVALMIYDGTEFQVVNNVIPTINGNTTFYVNNSTGNDSNNGLTTGTAWLTLSHAVSAIKGYNLNGFNATIQLANTGINYTNPPNFVAPSSGTLIIQGNSGSQSSYVIAGGAITSGLGVITINSGSVQLIGLTIQATNTTSNGLYVGPAFVTCQNVTFNNTVVQPAPYSLVLAGQGASVSMLAGNIYAGDASAAWTAEAGGQILMNGNQQTASSPVFSTAFANAATCGVIQIGVAGVTWSGSGATGARFSVFLNGVIATGGAGANFFPGSTPGSQSSGGQYA